MPYQIEYSPEVEGHLRALTTRQRSTVFEGIQRQLIATPLIETRNRRPMRPNPLAPWELRLGNLRVYYEVSEDVEEVVFILAVGVKERQRVRIGHEVIEL